MVLQTERVLFITENESITSCIQSSVKYIPVQRNLSVNIRPPSADLSSVHQQYRGPCWWILRAVLMCFFMWQCEILFGNLLKVCCQFYCFFSEYSHTCWSRFSWVFLSTNKRRINVDQSEDIVNENNGISFSQVSLPLSPLKDHRRHCWHFCMEDTLVFEFLSFSSMKTHEAVVYGIWLCWSECYGCHVSQPHWKDWKDEHGCVNLVIESQSDIL